MVMAKMMFMMMASTAVVKRMRMVMMVCSKAYNSVIFRDVGDVHRLGRVLLCDDTGGRRLRSSAHHLQWPALRSFQTLHPNRRK